jgi:cytochrome c biogenesis protein CcmG/thiol:disulfide interchange protein DsbE
MANRRTRMRAAGGALLLALAAGLVLWQAGLPQIHSLAVAPSFKADTLDHKRLEVSSQLDRPLVINFWATWCVPCIVEMPRLEAAYQAGKGSSLLIVGVNAGEDDEHVRAWVEANAISFPIVLDRFGELETAYQVNGYPTTFFVDRQGRVEYIVEGTLSEKELQRGLTAIGVAAR